MTTQKTPATKSEKAIIILSLIIVSLFGVIAILLTNQHSATPTDNSGQPIVEERLALVQELKDDYNHAYKGMIRYIGANDDDGELNRDIELLYVTAMPNVEYAQLSTTLETYDGSTIDMPAFYYDSDSYSAEWYMSETYGIELNDTSLIESSYVGEVVKVIYSGVNGIESVYIFPETDHSYGFIKTDNLNAPGDVIEMDAD